jgi:hypothetical protein
LPISRASRVTKNWRAALARGRSGPEGALISCRTALERCCAALRPRGSAALQGCIREPWRAAQSHSHAVRAPMA